MTPLERLQAIPVAGLVSQPTPLHRLDRLSGRLGTEVWIKRDDIGSVALAGNKIRKFDFILGNTVADILVTTGAGQSNSARAGAAAAAALGMHCHLVIGDEEPTDLSGNLILDDLLGATLEFRPQASWAELNASVQEVADRLQQSGRTAIMAPVGASSPLGSLGFALAFLEFDQQCRDHGLTPSTVVHASSSLGTHAGLLVGRAVSGRDIDIVGIDVGEIYPDLNAQANALAQDAAKLIGLTLSDPGADVRTDYVSPGYGHPSSATVAAIRLLARQEAVITDPVYSGKGAQGMLDLISRGDIHGSLVFWHTGGYHALFDPDHYKLLNHPSE